MDEIHREDVYRHPQVSATLGHFRLRGLSRLAPARNSDVDIRSGELPERGASDEPRGKRVHGSDCPLAIGANGRQVGVIGPYFQPG